MGGVLEMKAALLLALLPALGAGSGSLVETVRTSPTLETGILAPRTLPRRLTAGFALGRASGVVAEQRFGPRKRLLSGTILEELPGGGLQAPACGPSSRSNTLVCVDGRTGASLGEVPVPGRVTTVPLFLDGSLLFGTSQGFFVRTDPAVGPAGILGGPHGEFWGSAARQLMGDLRPATALDSKATAASKRTSLAGWKWFASGLSEYVGTPLLSAGIVLVQTGNHFLHALDLSTGEVTWSLRLGSDAVRMESSALAATGRQILVGTSKGDLLALEPKTGRELWKVSLPSSSRDQFSGIVAAPLVLEGRSVVVSNAGSLTQNIRLDTRQVVWSHALGSVASPRADDGLVFLGGEDGRVVCMDSRSGDVRWSARAFSAEPVVSLFVFPAAGAVVAAGSSGTLVLLGSETGSQWERRSPAGLFVGEFFPGTRPGEGCITYDTGGFGCFQVEASEQGRGVRPRWPLP